MGPSDISHPRVQEIEVRHQLGRIEAEGFLRGLAASDPAAAKAVAELDERRRRLREAVLNVNRSFAGSLGLDLDGARELVGKLAADRRLFTWLCARVNVTMAHDRPLAHDE